MSLPPVASNERSPERLRAELDFMYELCQVVASNTELKPILEWVVQKTTGMFEADEGSIRLVAQESAPPTAFTLVRKERSGIQAGTWPASISNNVLGFLLARGEPLVSADLVNDSRFPELRQVETRIRAVLAVALKVDNRCTGMLAVTESSPGREWTQDEMQLLSIVAANSASVIEQARLKVDAEEKRRLEESQKQYERELETARGIQMSLLPARPLDVGAWQIAGRVVPARQVGGDAYDFFPLGNGRAGVVIADVSGKGVPAALVTSNVQASVRTFCDGRTPLDRAIGQVNEVMLRMAGGKFVTLFFGELDPERHVLRYTNAGHNYPLVRYADGRLVELTNGGIPLGLIENTPYEQREVSFGPDDALLMYSDGITEAFNAAREEFGEEALRRIWSDAGRLAPAQAIERVFRAVEAFRGPATQNDDMTVVVVSANASG